MNPSNVGKAIEYDKVPNVAIVFLDNYPKIRSSLSGQAKKEFQAVLRRFREIDDEDVQYFASQIDE